MNCNGEFNVTQKKLADKGRETLFGWNRTIQKFESNAQTQCQLLGISVSYGSEIWVFHKSPEIERLHFSFCKC